MADNKVNSGLLEFSEDQKVFVALDAETSEVKKAVTIDGDGVETNIQGVQPTGKKEITSTAEVNVASYATAQVVDEDLVAGNIKKDVDILGVVGSYEGGGASDFGIAKVTVTNNSSATVSLENIIIIEDGSLSPGVEIPQSTSGTFDVVMYDNTASGFITGSYVVTVTGSITYDNEYHDIVITGDGTITIAGVQ